jgi:tripartite-type tricarboxylate transporter receptor subunit TctC
MLDRTRVQVHLRFACAFAVIVSALCISTPGNAQGYPNRPVTFVVPGPAGGGTDALGRALAQSMGKSMGQTIIVENKPGASGALAAQALAQAKPDGYTLFVTHAAPIQNSPHMGKTPYDVRRDFAFVAQIGKVPLVLVVNNTVPATNMREFLQWARENKGKITYGSYGAGSAGHLISLFLSQSRGLDMAHAAYKGEAPMLQDLIGGHVPWAFASAGTPGPFLASGQLRALAVTSNNRLPDLPNVPTMAEAGLTEPEFTMSGWVGVLAPAAVPAPIVAELEKHVLAALQTPSMQQFLRSYAIEPTASGSTEFRRDFEASDPILARLIEASGARQE